ncbi:MAG: transcription antitermination protein NusB [Muribaculaceae bacterium]|nr:transcription antitermination protein NusB [Muribaculaceae bacterium]
MINRVLIRIKVIQLLYSYLLIENHFMLESQPSAPTKEKRFAYSLYLDMLILMVKISERIEKRGGYRPLDDTRFIKKILADDTIKALLKKYQVQPFPLEGVVDSLAEVVKESGLFKTFVKNLNTETPEDDQIWEKIMNLIILPDPALNRAISKRENFTLRGVERMKGMLEVTFSNFYASRDNLDDALNTLNLSMKKARDLYFRLLILPQELVRLRESQIEDNRNKYIPTAEDLNPNMRFVDNAFVKVVEQDEDVEKYCEENKISWLPAHKELLESLLKTIMASDLYAEYMDFPATDLHTDTEFWRNVYKQIILHDEDFLEALETESVFWNDDLEIIGTFVLKTMKRFEEDSAHSPVLPMYKDEEDARFGKQLFTDVVRNKDVYRRYIDDFINVEHWDTDRLAVMDVVITMAALSEIINFPKIPLVVSINEYIELAKSYSTSKSGSFVNGLLSSIVTRLKEQGKINK